MLQWDCRERNRYNGTGVRGTIIIGLEGAERLCSVWLEMNIYNETGGR